MVPKKLIWVLKRQKMEVVALSLHATSPCHFESSSDLKTLNHKYVASFWASWTDESICGASDVSSLLAILLLKTLNRRRKKYGKKIINIFN